MNRQEFFKTSGTLIASSFLINPLSACRQEKTINSAGLRLPPESMSCTCGRPGRCRAAPGISGGMFWSGWNGTGWLAMEKRLLFPAMKKVRKATRLLSSKPGLFSTRIYGNSMTAGGKLTGWLPARMRLKRPWTWPFLIGLARA